MRAKKARTEIRQEQIAQTALELLAVRGWREVSLTTIARKVGVVTSAVYRHFSSKDEVLDAVLGLVDRSFQTNIQTAKKASGDPLVQLREILRRHAALILSGVPVPRIIMSEDVFAGSPRLRKRVHRIYHDYLAAIATIIREGQDYGQIQRHKAPKTLAVMWLGLVQSPAILWLLGNGDFDLNQHCEQAWGLFVQTLQPAQTSFASRFKHHENGNNKNQINTTILS